MIPKIQKWIDKKTFPQRVLLSGTGNLIDIAIQIASQLQKSPESKITGGSHEDTIIFRDTGKSFKIKFSDAAKKDGQNEFENVQGMIKWISQKPIENNYRIVILENFERATRDSPHSILKILEEPPPKAIFLLTTKNHYQIMETILSRMTVVRISDITTQQNFSDEIISFLDGTDLIQKFQQIEVLNKTYKKCP